MELSHSFQHKASPERKVFADIETTGLYHFQGHRIVEIALIETLNNKETGNVKHFIVNPECPIPSRVVTIHGLTDEKVAAMPLFKDVAAELRDFIGDSSVYITCRTKNAGPIPEAEYKYGVKPGEIENEYTLDIDFTNSEFSNAGVPIVPREQWINVRRWSEAMFGNGVMNCPEGTLEYIVERYGIKVENRTAESGHSAPLDTQLLIAAFGPLEKEYKEFLSGQLPAKVYAPKPQ